MCLCSCICPYPTCIPVCLHLSCSTTCVACALHALLDLKGESEEGKIDSFLMVSLLHHKDHDGCDACQRLPRNPLSLPSHSPLTLHLSLTSHLFPPLLLFPSPSNITQHSLSPLSLLARRSKTRSTCQLSTHLMPQPHPTIPRTCS